MADAAVGAAAGNGEFRNSFVWRSVTAGGGLVATLLTTVVAVRGLNAREAAVFLAILAGLMIGPMFGKLGLGQNVIRLVASMNPEDSRRMISSHLRAAFILSMLSAPVLAFASTAALLSESGHLTVLVLTSILLVAETVRLMLSDVFAAVGDVRASVATTHHVRTMVVLVPLVIVVVFVPHPTLIEILAVYAAVSVLLLLPPMLRARHLLTSPTRSPAPDRSADSRLFATIVAGLVLFALDGSFFVVNRGNVWLASAQFEPFDAARFGTVSTLAFQVTVLQGLASLAITPMAARLWATGQRERVLRMLSATATLTTAATGVVVLGLAVVGREVLGLAYGAEFAGSYDLLVVLAIGGLGQAAFGFSVPLLLISGQIRRAVTACLVVLAVMLPIAVVAAGWFGPTGLTIASAVAATTLPVAQWLAARGGYAGAPLPSWRIGRAVRAVRSAQPAPAPTPAVETARQ
jgi:O-antigen/teichoic acid export membrane protein